VLIMEEGVRFNGNCQMSGTSTVVRKGMERSERVQGEEAEAVQEAR